MTRTSSKAFPLVVALGLTSCSQYGQLNDLAKAAVTPQIAAPVAGGAAGSPGTAESASTAATTYSNKERKFHFTILAGWTKVGGDPNSDSAEFRKVGTSQHFLFHYTRMAPDFPAETAVKVSLERAKDEIKQGINIAAKRRDDACLSKSKALCARGWELIDSGKDGHQRIIWQAYDKESYYYNFMAASDPAEFQGARAALQQVIDSVRFE
jgi:hypothetical protein